MPGIRTSRIRHAVSCSSLEFKNASAEEKPWAQNPTDRIRLLSEFLRESSSSTIEIRGNSDMQTPFLVNFPETSLIKCTAKVNPRKTLCFEDDDALEGNVPPPGKSVYCTLVRVVTTLG